MHGPASTILPIGALLLAGCASAAQFPLPSDTTAPVTSTSTSAGRSDTPQLFAPGVISDAKRQWRITFTPDGRTAYFAESEGFFPATRQATSHVTRFVNGAWTEPEVAPFSGRYSDIDPFITPDGSRLYFSSIRPIAGVTRGDIDIWYVERTPQNLGPVVNTRADEFHPTFGRDGRLYFVRNEFGPTTGDFYAVDLRALAVLRR